MSSYVSVLSQCCVHLIAVTQLHVYYILKVSPKTGANGADVLFGDDDDSINQYSHTGIGVYKSRHN